MWCTSICQVGSFALLADPVPRNAIHSRIHRYTSRATTDCCTYHNAVSYTLRDTYVLLYAPTIYRIDGQGIVAGATNDTYNTNRETYLYCCMPQLQGRWLRNCGRGH